MDLSGAVGIVTGASSGIGWETCRTLSEAGARLVVTGRRAEALNELAGQLGGEVAVVAGDICDPALPQQLIDTVQEKFGQLDFVFNNAGIMNVGPVEELSD